MSGIQITDLDAQRVGRVVLAALENDLSAAVIVVTEAVNNGRTVQLILGLARYAGELARTVAPDDAADRVVDGLAALRDETD